MSHRPVWPPGLPAAPDGLERAFRAAERRRLRTAVFGTSLPVVVAAVLLASTVSSGTGSTSLDPVAPAPLASASLSAYTAPSGRVPAAGEDEVTVGGGARSATTPSGPGTAPSPMAALPPSLPPSAPQRVTGELTFRAVSSAKVHIDLQSSVHGRGNRVEIGGTWGALYLVADDGSLIACIAHLPMPRWDPDGSVSRSVEPVTVGDISTIPAGGYTAYVVGDGPVEVTLVLVEDEPGLSVTATEWTASVFRDVNEAVPPKASSHEQRLPIEAGAGWAGIAGGWYGASAAQAGAAVEGCLTVRDEACAGSDPRKRSSTAVTNAVNSSISYRIEVAPGLLATPRDIRTSADFNVGTQAQMTTYYVLVRL